MSNYEKSCEQCPYRNSEDFSMLAEQCDGLRIRIDEWCFVEDDGAIVGEVAKKACGSQIGPDIESPTISIEDWSNTPLFPSQLKELHDQGLLPDQIQ